MYPLPLSTQGNAAFSFGFSAFDFDQITKKFNQRQNKTKVIQIHFVACHYISWHGCSKSLENTEKWVTFASQEAQTNQLFFTTSLSDVMNAGDAARKGEMKSDINTCSRTSSYHCEEDSINSLESNRCHLTQILLKYLPVQRYFK